MQEYRAYINDGRIQQRFDLTATDEGTAWEQAKRLVDGHDVELWQGTVKVAKLTRQH
ncbi:hypothetical protein [Bradyrhizobium sp. JYMT SZCCT0180]|uniref:hypothetical protein n=1 Tax=Bradyrhizobium sp. JYMT SZCCT0180 TaxID=2807666 RepID=UPI001BA97463|nr:hypothetical protein [Bradyrhizobium sp. JYMT SZCCT0180]MBR1211276.1 hypothetical protein [Bradyrhizobium sp. JYMT SZCCT0180]